MYLWIVMYTCVLLTNEKFFCPLPSLRCASPQAISTYGLFDVKNFTQKRVLALNPDNINLPLMGDLQL